MARHALDLYTNPSTLASLKDKLQEKGISVVSYLGWVPKEHIQATPEDRAGAEQLFEALRDHDDVQGIYSNL